MRIRVLGSAAGGGVPQWNCGCTNCALARAGGGEVAPRTQDSLAVAGVGRGWLLVNASPDVLRQIEGFDGLWPTTRRGTSIAAIVLTNGDMDHVAGLLSLRESQPLRILCTPRVRSGLVEHNALLRTLARTPDQVTWIDLVPGREQRLDDVGLAVTAVPVPGKLPVHLAGVIAPSHEDNVALRVRSLGSPSRTAVLATAVGALEGAAALADGADALFFDGTFFSADELVAQGLGSALARDMAHVPVGGAEGSLAFLKGLDAGRKVYTHINNTNPMLRQGSPERAAVVGAGWEVAFDGMEVAL
ncbi:MAG TPA: MBL fold metallo-hydrolase [Polyangiaceae bacterium]|jgi:pyrroloquinoline quinone biosynthesis protein B